MRPSPAPTPCCFSPRARAFTASIVTFGARRPHWREVVLCSSCASERVRRSSQCGGSRNCQSPLQWRRALPCLVKLPEQGVCVGLLLPPCGAQHMLNCSSWAVCGATGCGAHVNRPAKTLCGGGGGAHTNSALPQAGFPESGEVLVVYSTLYRISGSGDARAKR